MKQYYAAVGQWRGGYTGKLGVKIYRYDLGSGQFEPVTIAGEDIAAGQIAVDAERGMIYAVDEKGNLPGDLGGGSYIYAFRIDGSTGALTLSGKQRSLSPFPCCLCLDPLGNYLFVSCNSDKQHITKMRQLPDGSFTSETVYDDAALLMFRLKEDGSLGELCDLSIPPNGNALERALPSGGQGKGILAHAGIISHLHSVMCSPDGKLVVACDLGMGKLYSYGIDRDNHKLVRLAERTENVANSIRYGAFHPMMPYLYINCEGIPAVLGYRYSCESGVLEKFCETGTLAEGTGITTGSNDILVHPNGKYVYCSNISDLISVMEIGPDGRLTLLQTVACGGVRPRALCLSPDERFLFSGNNRSSTITQFAIAEDGTLASTGYSVGDVLPSAIRIFALKC